MNSQFRFPVPVFFSLLIALIVVVQAGLLVHETEHAVAGGGEHCLSCWVADHQHSVATTLPEPRIPVAYTANSPATEIVIFTQQPRHYPNRAPPFQTFS